MSVADVQASIQRIEANLLRYGVIKQSSTKAGAASFDRAVSAATAPSSGSAVATGDVAGDDVVESAKKYVGVPYVLGGTGKDGIDCSALMQRAFGDLGIEIPRLVHQQQTVGTEVKSLKDAKPGDMIVLDGGDHIAMYLGNDMVIHAPYEGRSVSVQKRWFDEGDIVTIRRVVPSERPSTSAASAVFGATGAYGATEANSVDSLASLLNSSSHGTAARLMAARTALQLGGGA